MTPAAKEMGIFRRKVPKNALVLKVGTNKGLLDATFAKAFFRFFPAKLT